MRFTIDHATFFGMVHAVGRRFPGSKRDKVLRVSVISGVIYVAGSCRAGAALAIDTQDGECSVPRKEFEDVLDTFKGQHILTIQVKVSMTIGSFKMPVTGYSTCPTPPRKFEWFGPNPTPTLSTSLHKFAHVFSVRRRGQGQESVGCSIWSGVGPSRGE
jgi:hypothetical protein